MGLIIQQEGETFPARSMCAPNNYYKFCSSYKLLLELYGGIAEDLGSGRLLDHWLLLGYQFLVHDNDFEQGAAKLIAERMSTLNVLSKTSTKMNKQVLYISIWHGMCTKNKV
jgi:hypothetical protein